MNKLTPSIEEIEQHLFAPSYALLSTWIESPTALDAEVKQQLASSVLAQQAKQQYLQTQDDCEDITNVTNTFTNTLTDTTTEVPYAIQQLIQQRSDSANHLFSAMPHAGLIVLLTEGKRSASDLYLEIANPLIVILNKPMANSQQWQGWMIAPETDYASCWDMVLDATIDSPLDSMVGMVQVWNPVVISLSLIEKTIGELAVQRLTVLNALSDEWKQQHDVLNKLSHNMTEYQVTYQAMYYEMAHLIKQHVAFIANPYQHWLVTFLAHAQKVGQWFVPVPVINYAMGGTGDLEAEQDAEQETEPEKNWLFGDYYLFSFNEYKIDDTLLIEVLIKYTHPEDTPCVIEYNENDCIEHHAELSVTEAETEFICDPDNACELLIKNSQGDVLHSIDLTRHFDYQNDYS